METAFVEDFSDIWERLPTNEEIKQERCRLGLESRRLYPNDVLRILRAPEKYRITIKVENTNQVLG